MAMQQAVNPETGEVLFLVNNQWVPPTQTAVNEAGQKAYLVGNEWQLPPGANTTQEQQGQVTVSAAPPEEPKSTGITGAISDIGNAINDVLSPGQATLGAGEKGIVNAKQAVSNAQLAQLINNQAADKEQYGEYYERAPKGELEKISARDKAIEEKIQNLAQFGLERKAIEEKRGVNPLTQSLTNLRGSEEYKAADGFDQLKMIGNTVWDKRGNLGGYAAGIALESLPATVPTIVAATAARFGGFGPKGAAIMGGSGSALTEFGNQYAELRAEGMDHKEAWEKAGVKSAVIGLFDAASFGSAGKAAGELLKNIEKGYIKEAAKQTGKEVSKQAMYGMAGEGLGSVAINEKVDPLAVIEEGIGEMAGAPLEAVSTFKSKQQEAIDAANKPVPPPVVPPAPPPGPQITNADGTPIAPAPLDTAEKQIAAKASTPITSTTTPDIEAQAKAKATELGIPLEDARKLVGAPPVATPVSTVNAINTGDLELDTIANRLKAKYNLSNEKAIKQAAEVIRQQKIVNGDQNGTKPSTGVDTGTNQPSVLSIEDGLQPAGGVTTPQSTGLASNIGTTGQPGVRTEDLQTNEPVALDERIQASAQVLGVLQQAQEGYQIAQQEYAETGSSPTLKKVRAYIMKHFTPALGNKKAKAYADWLLEEGNLNSGDMGSFHPAFDETVGKVVIPKVELNKPAATPTQTTTETTPPDVTSEVTPAATTPTATKGKRTGRPRVELTPEETAAKKQAKAAQTKEWKATDKQIAAAKAVLENPEPVREDFKTQDAYLEAGMRYRSERNQALDTLHGVSTGPQRVGKLGQSAKVGLDHPSISVQERTNLQQRVDLKKQSVGKVSKAAQNVTTDTYNPKYEKFTTVQQAINHILSNGTTFERLLARRLAPFLRGVQLKIVTDNTPELDQLRTEEGYLRDSFKGANGMYGSWTNPADGKLFKYIFLRSAQFGNTGGYQGMNNTIFLHEALHAAINSRIDEYLQLLERGSKLPEELAKAINGLQLAMLNAQDAFLERKLSGQPVDRRLDDLFNRIGAFEDLKEFVSYGLTEEVVQEFLLSVKGEAIPDQPGFFKTLFNTFTESIRQLFNMDRNHQSGLQDLILVTEGLLKYNPIMESQGVSAARKKKAKAQKLDQDTKKVMRSQNIHDVAEGFGGWIRDGHKFEDLVDILNARFGGMSETAIKGLLFELRTSDIIRWKGNEIAGLKEIDEFTQKMSAMRTNMLEAYAAKADQLAKFIVTNKGGDKILGNAMHLARLKQVTPDAHATAIEAAANDPKVIELTKQIEDPATDQAKIPNLTGQRTRRKNDIQVVYDAWAQLGKIEGGHEMYKMVRQFYKDNFNLQRHYLDERIERLQELPGDAKDEKTPKGQLMAEIRKMQEKDVVQEYFPLMRHGQVWFRETGKDKGFILFDEPWQRNLYEIKRAKELGK